MKCNMGRNDRVIRTIIGLAIIGFGIGYGSWWGLIGLIPLITAITARCPLYVPFGISTLKKKKE